MSHSAIHPGRPTLERKNESFGFCALRALGMGLAVGSIAACSATPAPGGGSGGSSGSGGASSGPCDVTGANVVCHSKPIVTITSGADTRRVYWNNPVGAAPSAGFPAVILYQGSFFGPSV